MSNGHEPVQTSTTPRNPVVAEAYWLPSSPATYRPDPSEPIDRWFQASNSSNARTTSEIILDLCPEPPRMLIDPFAGAGSSAAAARLLSIPFFGIESDPVLAATSLFKATADPGRLGMLSPDGLAGVVAAISRTAGRPLSLDDMRQDLANTRPADPLSRVVWGDATHPSSWPSGALAPGHAVVYTSPPFDLSSPRTAAPQSVVDQARRLMSAHRSTGGDRDAQFSTYTALTLAALERLLPMVSSATVIIEHEPGDDRDLDTRSLTVERIGARFPTAFRRLRVLESQAFSKRGLLSFIVCEIAR